MPVFCYDLHASTSFHSTRPDSIVLQRGWFLSAQKYYVVSIDEDTCLIVYRLVVCIGIE